MCYNCGCRKPDDDHGDPRNITNRTFEEAAKAGNKGNTEQAKENTGDLLREKISVRTGP